MSRITYTQAPAPELPGKIKAQQDANRVDIDLVLTGNDALSAGIDQKLWVPLLTDYAAQLPDLDAIYSPVAAKMQAAAQDQGGAASPRCPAGPLLEYMPDGVKTPPTTARGTAGMVQGRIRNASCMPARRIPAPAAPS